MFYEIKKNGVLLERMNPLADEKGRSKSERESDADALRRADELGADEVVTSVGRAIYSLGKSNG